MQKRSCVSFCLFLTFSFRAQADQSPRTISGSPPQAALDAITPDALLEHIKVLASDEFEGRAPGSQGEELSVKYITEQFKAARAETGKSEWHLHAGSSARRNHDDAANASFTVGDKTTDAEVPG